MARPTLSKVLYMQQLGRGTRKAPGKKELIVFDFIDNVGRYSMPQSVHRVFQMSQYKPGALVAGTDEALHEDQEAMEHGESPLETLDVSLWAKGYREIDIFNWQELRRNMWSAGEMEVELGASSRLITNAAKRGDIRPDHTVPVGENLIYFFAKSRREEIRQELGLPQITKDTIKSLFMDFVGEMDMSSSYKPVFMKGFLQLVDKKGKASVKKLTKAFREFYEERRKSGLLIEKGNMRMAKVEELADEEVQTIMLQMPFEKFERRKYVKYDRDFAYIAFQKDLWIQLNDIEKSQLIQSCEEEIQRYYERITG